MAQVVKLNTMKMPNFNPLSNYLIEKTIGQGTFGKVKLGTHKTTGEKVAVKILEKEKIENQGDLLRVQREIHILRKIRHPNIIQLFEIIESEVKIYLIMEYAQGGELFEHIVSRQRLDEREAGRILWQLINSIEYLHLLGIVHRDLKPENILLDTNFGLSNLYQPSQNLHTPCGSPCYAAPEMVSGKPYNGLKTDLWSCGIILYAMICGCVPFEDPNTKQLYEKIKTQEFSVPKWLSPQSIDLLKGMLQKDPNKRISIDQIRQHDFVRFTGKQSIPRGINTKEKNFVIEVDEDAVDRLQEMSVDQDEVRTMVKNNKHNCITATYYLVLSKMMRNQTQGSPQKRTSQSPQPKQKSQIVCVSKVVGSINETQRKQIQNEQLFISNKHDAMNANLDIVDPSKVSGTGGSSSMERIVKKDLIQYQQPNQVYETNPPRKNSKSTQHIPGQQLKMMMMMQQQQIPSQSQKNKSQEPVRDTTRELSSVVKKTQLPRQVPKQFNQQVHQSVSLSIQHKQLADRLQTDTTSTSFINKNKFTSLVGQTQKMNTDNSPYVRHQTHLKPRSNAQPADIFYNPMTERPTSELGKGSNTQRDQKKPSVTNSLHQKVTNQSWRANDTVGNVVNRPSVSRATASNQKQSSTKDRSQRVNTNTFFGNQTNMSMQTRNRTDENNDLDRSGQGLYNPVTQPSERDHQQYTEHLYQQNQNQQQVPTTSQKLAITQQKKYLAKLQSAQPYNNYIKDNRQSVPYKNSSIKESESKRTDDYTQRYKNLKQ